MKVKVSNVQKTPQRLVLGNKPMKKSSMIKIFLLITILSILLMVQYYRITKINISISNLETQVKEVTMLNDSLYGEVLKNRDLNYIEDIAINQYGMIKPDSDNFTYVSYEKDSSNTLKKAQEEISSEEESSGFLNFLNIFR